MSGYTELAKLFKERDNQAGYSPMLGKIIELPNLKIKLGSKIILIAEDIKFMFDIYEKITYENRVEYVNLNKEVVLLPYANNQKFIAIGVVR